MATVREFYPYLAEQFDDQALGEQVELLAPRVMELTEFLVRHLGVGDLGAHFPHRVTYHPWPSLSAFRFSQFRKGY